ncbi:MAG: ATP-binding protein [Firmicutes bacterium]|nr:ATP-binding protein [Bacillota bacterium]
MPEGVKKRFWFWFWPVMMFATGLLLWSVLNLRELDLVALLIFTAIAIAAQFRSVSFSAHQSFTLLFIVNLAALFVFGLPGAMICVFLGYSVELYRGKRAWYKSFYNLAVNLFSTLAAGWLFQILTQTPLAAGLFSQGSAVVRGARIGALLPSVLLAILTQYFVGSILQVTAKSLAGEGTALKHWFGDFPKILSVYVLLDFISIVMAETYSIGGVLNLLAVVTPLLLARYAFYLLSQARESELRVAAELQNVLDGIPATIIAADPAGKVTTFNRMAEKLTGLTSKEAISRPLRELPGIPGLLSSLEEDRKEPGTMSEAVLVLGEGTRLPIRGRFAHFNDRKGTRQGQLLIFWDITAEKQLEAARLDLAKLAAFNQVAAALTHEMKNPLTIVRGYAEHLAETRASDPESREALQIIIGEADRLTSILEEVLDSARPSASPPVPLDLHGFLTGLESIMKAQCARAGVTLEFVFGGGNPRVMATEERLQRVFTNLFFNSLDALPKGGRIRVATRPLDQARWVEIQVEDNGKGIRASDLSRVFDPFFSTKKHGTGLGLTNCAQIIRGYGGTISLESREGEGTAVFVRLPVQLG